MRSSDYYLSLQKQDYYLNNQEPRGQWWGNGAKIRGLSGDIDEKTFANLYFGMSDDGEKLVENANKINRRPGWDVTFSSDKSVSAIWAVANADTRAMIEKIHDSSVNDALSYFEQHNSLIRVQHEGIHWRERGELIVGLFQHGSSRAEDPELHTHACILNVAVTPSDHRTRTIDSHEIYTHKMMMGSIYRASIATRLMEAGFTVERTDNRLMSIAGVPEDIKRHWSTRSEAIEDHLTERGLEDTAENRAKAALVTRIGKRYTARDELLTQWAEEGHQKGFTADEVERLRRPFQERSAPEKAEALERSIQEAETTLLANQAHFTKRDLVRAVCDASIGQGVSIPEIDGGIERYIQQDRIVNLGEHNRTTRYTTKDILTEEQAFIDKLHQLHDRTDHTVSESSWSRYQRSLDKDLSTEQRAAIYHLTMNSDLVCMTGMAGTGKSAVLKPARELWEHEGYSVLGVSLSGKATDGLATGAGFTNTMTIDSLFARIDYAKHQGSIANDLLQFDHPLQRQSIVVVDEAGMVDNAKLKRLVDEVAQQHGKLVLVGDAKQLQAISNGGAFAVACTQVGQTTLSHIYRQKEEWARQAVHHFAEGKTEQALQAYAARSLLHVEPTKTALYNRIIADWEKAGGAHDPAAHLMLCATNREVAILNQQAQAARIKAGELGTKPLWLNGSQFYMGDRVVCLKNNRTAEVRNGNFGEILHYSSLSHSLKLKTDDGAVKTINVKEYADIALGYAVTTHKAQGVTVNNTYVLAGSAMQDREMTYVQMSRHREKAHLYAVGESQAEAIQTLTTQMKQSREKQFATTLLEATQHQEQQRAMHQ